MSVTRKYVRRRHCRGDDSFCPPDCVRSIITHQTILRDQTRPKVEMGLQSFNTCVVTIHLQLEVALKHTSQGVIRIKFGTREIMGNSCIGRDIHPSHTQTNSPSLPSSHLVPTNISFSLFTNPAKYFCRSREIINLFVLSGCMNWYARASMSVSASARL